MLCRDAGFETCHGAVRPRRSKRELTGRDHERHSREEEPLELLRSRPLQANEAERSERLVAVGYGIGTFFLALAGLAADGERGSRLLGRSLRGTLFLTHWLLVVPAALLKIAFGSGQIRYVKTPRLDSNSP